MLGVLFTTFNAISQRPSYTPPSPQAFTFMRYGEHPVDHSTGLVDIRIPFFTLSVKDFDLPISASYHASGRKVDMNFSELGLNWKLDAYGMITREIKGISDLVNQRDDSGMEQGRYFFESAASDDIYRRGEKFARRLQLSGDAYQQPRADAEYDIYHITFNGLSASFIIKRYNQIVFLNYFPYKAEFANNRFNITDDKGVVYTFGVITESEISYGTATAYGGTNGTMCWAIAKIQTPGGEYIRFRYGYSPTQNSHIVGNLSYGAKATLGDHFYRYPNPSDGTGTGGAPLGLVISNTMANENYRIFYLSKIESSNGYVDFKYDQATYSLNEVVLKSDMYTPVTTVTINYKKVINKEFTIPNNQGRSISEIVVSGQDISPVDRYTFDYYSGIAHGNSLIDYCYGKDYWGYANLNSNSNLIPVGQVDQFQSIQGNVTIGDPSRRNSDYSQKLIGMLMKITYPTGGWSEFEYEDNQYAALGGTKSGPGIRIKKIKRSDGQRQYIHEYQYGSGSLLWSPRASDFETSVLVTSIPQNGTFLNAALYGTIVQGTRYRLRTFFSDPVGHIAIAYRQPVYYREVTEYLKSGNGEFIGKTVYNYLLPTFDQLTDSFSDAKSGRTTYYDSFIPHLYSKVLLQSKSVYSSNGNSFSLQSRESRDYQKIREVIIPQLTYYRRHQVSGTSYNGKSAEEFIEVENPGWSNDADWAMPWKTIRIIDYNLVSACMRLESVILRDSIGSKEVVRKTNYQYGSAYTTEPSSIETVESDGSVATVKKIYPDDIKGATLLGGNLAAQELTAIQKLQKTMQHEVGVPIQTEYYKDGVLKRIERNIFKEFSGKSLLSRIDFKNAVNDAFVTSYEVLSYDIFRNPLEIRADKRPNTSILWNTARNRPIAIAENSNANDIAFTGFEAGESGNWTWNGQVVGGSGYSYEGQGFLGLSPGQWVRKTGLDASKTYRVSVWLWGSTIPGNGYVAVAKKGDWTNFVKTVSGITTFTFSYAESGPGMVDNISLCPVESSMSTYTYRPLVGMTSMTDGRGFTEYYEYDGLGRLKTVKDFDGNILKDYDFNYRP